MAQTTIHGADDLITSSESDSKEQPWPPTLEQPENEASSYEDETSPNEIYVN